MATTVPIDTICKLLDLTPQRINQLAREGVIPKVERGRYELVPVVRSYIHYLRMGNLRRDLPEDDYTTHRMRLTRARADITEMERAQMENRLIPSSDVELTWNSLVSNARNRLIAIPTKVAPVVYASKNLNEIRDIIKDEIYSALDELANAEVRTINPILGNAEVTGDEEENSNDLEITSESEDQ
jgi:phage terminase Nu1 subunit (DNA packaging protein)